MNDLATSSDVRVACQTLQQALDGVFDDLKGEMRRVKRKLIAGVTVSMAIMNTIMFFALDATLNA